MSLNGPLPAALPGRKHAAGGRRRPPGGLRPWCGRHLARHGGRADRHVGPRMSAACWVRAVMLCERRVPVPPPPPPPGHGGGRGQGVGAGPCRLQDMAEAVSLLLSLPDAPSPPGEVHRILQSQKPAARLPKGEAAHCTAKIPATRGSLGVPAHRHPMLLQSALRYGANTPSITKGPQVGVSRGTPWGALDGCGRAAGRRGGGGPGGGGPGGHRPVAGLSPPPSPRPPGPRPLPPPAYKPR